jgi:hypothetical protein
MCRACHYLCCEARSEARCGCEDCPNPRCHGGDAPPADERERAPDHDGDAAPAMLFRRLGFARFC